jgi:hypothetical protein
MAAAAAVGAEDPQQLRLRIGWRPQPLPVPPRQAHGSGDGRGGGGGPHATGDDTSDSDEDFEEEADEEAGDDATAGATARPQRTTPLKVRRPRLREAASLLRGWSNATTPQSDIIEMQQHPACLLEISFQNRCVVFRVWFVCVCVCVRGGVLLYLRHQVVGPDLQGRRPAGLPPCEGYAGQRSAAKSLLFWQQSPQFTASESTERATVSEGVLGGERPKFYEVLAPSRQAAPFCDDNNQASPGVCESASI